MSKRVSRSARAAFAALVAAGLTFGAGSVLASPSATAGCPYNPGSGQFGLSCSTHTDCDRGCKQYAGEWSMGVCDRGCCVCAI